MSTAVVSDDGLSEPSFRQCYDKAATLAEAGDLEAALGEYNQLLRQAQELDPLLLAQVHNDLAFINFATGHVEEARNGFLRALAVDPFLKEAHENLRKLDELVGGNLADEQVIEYLAGLYGDNESAMSYINVHLRRFTETLNFLPRAEHGMKLLELGANTLFSPLLLQFTDYEVAHGDFWPGPERTRELQVPGKGDNAGFSMVVSNFDAEKDRYPWEDESFDVVLACEIIEHLPNDPMHMLSECNRVLKPGGRVVITTPNITSYRSLNAVLNGYPPYIYNKFSSNNGGRHVKEYAPVEFEMILPKAGFGVEKLDTRNIWADSEPGVSYWGMYRRMHNILRELGSPLRMRGEDIFVVGVKREAPRERYPVEFYD